MDPALSQTIQPPAADYRRRHRVAIPLLLRVGPALWPRVGLSALAAEHDLLDPPEP